MTIIILFSFYVLIFLLGIILGIMLTEQKHKIDWSERFNLFDI